MKGQRNECGLNLRCYFVTSQRILIICLPICTSCFIMELVKYLESGMVYDHLQCHHVLTSAENNTDQVSPLNTAPVAPVLLSSSLPSSFDGTIFLSLENNCRRLDLGLQVNLAKLEHPVERQTHLPKQKKFTCRGTVQNQIHMLKSTYACFI